MMLLLGESAWVELCIGMISLLWRKGFYFYSYFHFLMIVINISFLFLFRAGFADPRLVEHSPIAIKNRDIENAAGKLQFFSATYRLFKLSGLETACEDYGQAVVYNGKCCSLPTSLVLDKGMNHYMEREGKEQKVEKERCLTFPLTSYLQSMNLRLERLCRSAETQN